MNSPAATPVQARRSYARWIIAGLVLLVSPVIIVGLGVWSVLTLNRDAAILRREVMTATGSDWHTKVQLSTGCVLLGTARAVLHFVHHKDIDDARLALAAVKNASVGVYERNDRDAAVSLEQLLVHTDKVMQRRGWNRLVGVVDGRQTVLIYTPEDEGTGDKIDLCIAVVDGRQMVIVSTCVDAGELTKLVERHAPEGFRGKLKLAKL
jgi:hypothetical protein